MISATIRSKFEFETIIPIYLISSFVNVEIIYRGVVAVGSSFGS